MATPQKVRVKVPGIYFDMDGDDRDQAIAQINQVFDEAERQGFTDVRLDWYRVDYGDGYEYVLMGDRMETVGEAAKREAREAQTREWREQNERETFERLKKKFG